MERIEEIIKNETLTYNQQVLALAKEAENTIDPIKRSTAFEMYLEAEAFCTLFEGNAPYRPRYIVPNYEKLLKEGCKFLELDVATNIWEATNNLLIFYKHVPSVTSYPVYIGNIDTLLEPFTKDDSESRLAIKLFLIHIDKTLTDSFVHANIGPYETVAGKIILELMSELSLATPNLTLKYDEEKTSEEFATLAALTSLKTAKPSFANDKMYSFDYPDGYGIVSCYNGLAIGGGGFTLMRINLNHLSAFAKDSEDFINNVLPHAVKEMSYYINDRIEYICNSAFFKSSFLVKEGFIDQNKFSGMLGVVGLAECVNNLLKLEEQTQRFGHSVSANEYALRVIEKIENESKKYPSKHTTMFDGISVLHAQVGIDTDTTTSPGARIPVGEEPAIYDHILMSAPFHKPFVSGIGDIFVFDQTYIDKPEAIVSIVKGAMKNNLRYISTYSQLCDVVRVTGYLVKRSEMEKFDRGEVVLNNSTVLGVGARDGGSALDRKKRN